MNSHTHNFAESEWPFNEPINTGTYCTGRVAKQGFSILHVSHDEDGDWQFLDGTTQEAEECTLLCFGCIFERDRTIGSLADLPRGWMAWRDSPDHKWERYKAPHDELQ
jgi:hypothetical protein